MTAQSAFAQYETESWPHHFHGELVVENLAGGVPNNPNIAEGWIKTKLGSKDDILRQQVAETMEERGVTADEAVTLVAEKMNINGFKRDDEHGLFIEGRQLKSAIKEAANVAVASGKISGTGWGKTNKGLRSFIAEHVHVVDRRLYLGCDEPTGISQGFVSTFRGTAIEYWEYVNTATITFTVQADYKFGDREWALIWTTGQMQGLGAKRSQGFGRYIVTKWEGA